MDDVLTVPKSSKPDEFDVIPSGKVEVRYIATIFDPLGFISLAVVKAKIILLKSYGTRK